MRTNEALRDIEPERLSELEHKWARAQAIAVGDERAQVNDDDEVWEMVFQIQTHGRKTNSD